MDKQVSQTIYLGIDGGGSTCRARLRDGSGRILGSGKSGPANLRLGIALVKEQILACTNEALTLAGLENFPLQNLYAGLGLAGAVLSEDIESASALRSMFATCAINNDAYIACLGAHLGEDGAIVIIGTGSCAQVISAQTSQTYGGWGFDISDQASGAWIGQHALRATVLAMDGLQPATALSRTIGQQFSHQASEVLRWCETAKPADYAKFAPSVFSLAEKGEKQSLSLVNNGCEQLILLIRAVEKHGTGRITLLGGLADSYQHHLPEEIRSLLSSAKGDALDGALLTAGLPVLALNQ